MAYSAVARLAECDKLWLLFLLLETEGPRSRKPAPGVARRSMAADQRAKPPARGRVVGRHLKHWNADVNTACLRLFPMLCSSPVLRVLTAAVAASSTAGKSCAKMNKVAHHGHSLHCELCCAARLCLARGPGRRQRLHPGRARLLRSRAGRRGLLRGRWRPRLCWRLRQSRKET